jgi:hypothetical protein
MATKRRYKRRTYRKKKRTQKRRVGGGINLLGVDITNPFAGTNNNEQKNKNTKIELKPMTYYQKEGFNPYATHQTPNQPSRTPTDCDNARLAIDKCKENKCESMDFLLLNKKTKCNE